MISGTFGRLHWLASLTTGIAARLIQLATGLVAILLLLRVMPPTELGLFYIWSAIGIALSFIGLYFLTFPIQRLLPVQESERLDFLASATLPTIAISLVFAGLYGVLSWLSGGNSTAAMCVLTIAYAGAEAVFAQGTNIASAVRNQRAYFLAVLARSLAILGALYAATGSALEAQHALLIYWTGSFFPFLIFLQPLRQSLLRGRFKFSIIRNLFDFGWPYMVGQLFRQPVERGDRLIVGLLLGPAAAGQYAVATDLARRVIQGVTINARLTLVRDVVEAHERGDHAARQQSINLTMLSVLGIGLPLAAVLSLFGAGLVGPVIGENLSAEALAILSVVSFAFVLEALRAYVLALPFELTRQSRYDAIVSVCGCVLQTALLFVFGHFWHLTGFALAVLTTQAALTALAAIISTRLMSFSFPRAFPVAAAVLTGMSIWLMQFFGWVPQGSSWLMLFGVAATYGAMLTAAIFLLGWLLLFRGGNARQY